MKDNLGHRSLEILVNVQILFLQLYFPEILGLMLGMYLIRQYKISEAIVSLKEISNKYPDALITPLSKLRLAILFVEFTEYDKELSVALSINDSTLKDKGLALAGEIEEKFLGNSENALKHYYRLLSECESSLLIEPIRLNIRKLSKLNES